MMRGIRSVTGTIRDKRECVRIYHTLAGAEHLNEAVLLVGHELKYSGASLLLIHIANELCRRNYKVILLINAGSDMDPGALSQLDKSVLLFQMHATKKSTDYLLALLRSRGCHQCIANTVVTGLFATVLEKNHFRPVWLIHEMECSCRILRAEALVSQIVKTAKTVVFPERTVQESFLSLGSADLQIPFHLISQGIYKSLCPSVENREEARALLADTLGIPRNATLLVCAGAVNFGKGPDLLVAALTELTERGKVSGTQYHVLWIGHVKEDDPYAIWLNKQIKDSGISGCWHWSGYVADETKYADLLIASDIFVLPSREDSYPSVVLEAQGMGKPVITFEGNGGAVSMVMQQQGRIAKSGSVQDLCCKIEQVASELPDLAPHLAQYAQQLQKEKSFPEYVNSILSLL